VDLPGARVGAPTAFVNLVRPDAYAKVTPRRAEASQVPGKIRV